MGYHLTDKQPTWRHHCLAHVLSDRNLGSNSSLTEVWGGPLAGGDYVLALLNRGNSSAQINARWSMFEVDGVGDDTEFAAVDLFANPEFVGGTTPSTAAPRRGGLVATVPGHDIAIYRLTSPHARND